MMMARPTTTSAAATTMTKNAMICPSTVPEARVREGRHVPPLPAPGVYARHNAVDTPALLPDGTAADGSVSRVLLARGTVQSAPELADDVHEMVRSEEELTK